MGAHSTSSTLMLLQNPTETVLQLDIHLDIPLVTRVIHLVHSESELNFF
jgi:hypothetical protein